MFVREKRSKNASEVHGIYWAEYNGRIQRFHLIVPEDEYPGFLSVPEADCDVVDPSMNGLVLAKDTRGKDAFLHPVLLDSDLLNQLIEHEEGAMDRFLLAKKAMA